MPAGIHSATMVESRQGAPGKSGDCRWVRDVTALETLARELAVAPAHAFDSESNSGFAYREQLCLLQFNVAGRLWLVDLVALPGGPRALESIRAPLESPTVTTWVHGGEFDVGSMKRDFDLSLGGLWDTQQAATFLGWEKTGYGAVVERVCSVTLDKAYAHYDWSRRPIDEKALRYALDDVRFLPRVAAGLEGLVGEADLAEEVLVANQAVMDATWTAPTVSNGLWRIKGVHKLDARQLPRLMALWEWREAEAKRRDLPPGRLLHPEALLAIVRRHVRSVREMRGLLRGRNSGYAEEIFVTLQRAENKPPEVPPRPRGSRPTAGEASRLKRLKEWRRAEAERRDVPQPVVLPPTAMQFLAREGAADLAGVPQLGKKRIRLYGTRLVELCG